MLRYLLFSWLQVGGVESVEVPEFVGVVNFCGGSSVLEENSNVWSVWSDRIKSGGFGDVVGDLNKSTVSSGSDLVEDVCSLDFWGQGQSRIHLTIYCQWKKQSKICWLLLLYQPGTKVGVATVLLLTSMTAPFRTPLSFKTAKSWLLPRWCDK
jgi:hypothetical protein